MRAGGGSQLDAYLETFNVSPVPGKVTGDDDKRADEGHRSRFKKTVLSFCTSLFTFISLISTEIILGFLRDIALVTELHSNSLDELEVSITASSINSTVQSRNVKREEAVDFLRRGVLIFFLVSCGMHPLQLDRQFMVFCFVDQLQSTAFRISLFLTVLPILLGIFFSRWIIFILQSTRRTENSTVSVLGWIKKVQLISLGRQITHPMAPITKIEEAARELYGDMALSLPEMRRGLRSALLTFDAELLAALKAFYEDRRIAAFECEIDSPLLCSEIPSTSQLQLLTSSIFKNRIISCYHCIHCHVASRSLVNNDDHCRKNVSWCHLLRLPILLLNIAHSVDRLQKKLNLICREVSSDSWSDEEQSLTLNNPSTATQSTPTQGSGLSDRRRTVEVASKRYTEIRLSLLRQMLKIEGDLSRLWLCERALSLIAMTSLLLPSSVGPQEELQETEVEMDVRSKNNRVNIAAALSFITDQRARQAIACLNKSLHHLSTPEYEGKNRGRDNQDSTEMESGLESQIKNLISILTNNSCASIPDNHSGSDMHIKGKESTVTVCDDDIGLCGVNEELGSNSGIILFESNDGRHADNRMDSLRAIERMGDYNEGRRIVDVYAATVTMLPPAASERYRSIRSIDSDSNNESKKAKLLLFELQKHIEMLDMTNSIVERMQSIEVNDNGTDRDECDSKNVPEDSVGSENIPAANEKSEDCNNEVKKLDLNGTQLFETPDNSTSTNTTSNPSDCLYTRDLSDELSVVLSGLSGLHSNSVFFNGCENYGSSSDDDDGNNETGEDGYCK